MNPISQNTVLPSGAPLLCHRLEGSGGRVHGEWGLLGGCDGGGGYKGAEEVCKIGMDYGG